MHADHVPRAVRLWTRLFIDSGREISLCPLNNPQGLQKLEVSKPTQMMPLEHKNATNHVLSHPQQPRCRAPKC